jgi:predicted transcriptional regulator
VTPAQKGQCLNRMRLLNQAVGDKKLALTIDTSSKGLAMVLKDYQEVALKYLWRLDGEGASSRDVWMQVNEDLEGKRTISRASIINFLNSMVDEGVLNYTETTGKGGHRRIYSAKYNEAEFKEYVAEVVLKNLLRDFPEETKKALRAVK